MVGGLDAWREGLCQTLADGAGDGDRAGPPGGDQADREDADRRGCARWRCASPCRDCGGGGAADDHTASPTGPPARAKEASPRRPRAPARLHPAEGRAGRALESYKGTCVKVKRPYEARDAVVG